MDYLKQSQTVPSGRGRVASLRAIKEALKTTNDGFLVDVAIESLGKNATKSIFSRKAKVGKSDNLEKPMGQLLQAIAKEAFNTSKDLGGILSGKTLTNLEDFSLNDVDEKVKQNFLKNLVSETGKSLEQVVQKPDGIAVKYTSRAIKTDLSAMQIEMDIQRDISEDLKATIKLINNSNLSVKNYSSLKSIKLGSSDLWKSYSLVTRGLSNANDIVRGFNTYEAVKNKQNDFANNVKNHMNHIRFVYELVGQGQTIGTQKISSEVDFLVVNNPTIDAGGVKVYSVKQLVSNYLEREDLGAQLKSFSIANPFT